MAGVEFDSHELRALTADLDRAAKVAPAETAKVVTKGAVNIKRDAARRVSGMAHAPAYPRSIDFDPVRTTPAAIWTEIGPNKDKRQGALGNLIEFGSVNNAPRPHIAPAGEAEEPKFAKAIEDLAVKAIEP